MAKVVGMFDYCPELVPKKTYTAAQGRASGKWQRNNKERVNNLARERHRHKMRTDMDYRNMKAAATKRSNEKRKAKVNEYKASRLSVVKDTTINEELNDIILELKED
jgi:hypothetical protein